VHLDIIRRRSVPLCFFRVEQTETVRLLCSALLIATPLGAASSLPPNTSLHSIEISATQSVSLDQPLTQSALDRQIERVLQNPEFSWREPSAPAHYPKQKSIFEHWMGSIRQMLLSLGNWIDWLLKSLLKTFDLKPPIAQPAPPEAPLSSGLFNALGYLFWAAFAGTLILFVIRVLKLKATRRPLPIVPLQKPDLADEAIEANQLPDNEWYALAREKIAAGEFRQAQRALFLAILSYLASHRFITVERWKSNSDYEKELGRKAKRLSELPALFAQSRLGFERCWYGADSVTPEDLESYNNIYERIKHAAA
jgi:hypothetical protein